jgi:prepilin-type N-terminal cleavage/methylation domain-containing protein
MIHTTASSRRFQAAVRRASWRGFTLVELLTVIAIISLLIAILLPSLSTARDQAKNTQTKALHSTLETGLELFKNENEKEFRQTHGYPSSNAGPDIHEATPPTTDILYGAHWLPRTLLGKDLQGFVPKLAVPHSLEANPEVWYDPDPLGDGSGPLERVGPYVSPDSVDLVPTYELPGTPPDDSLISVDPASPETSQRAPVIVDTFGRPILYYRANELAKVIAQPDQNTTAPDADDKLGVFVHEDNWGFTGKSDQATDQGWLFSASRHRIELFGNTDTLTIDDERNSFCYYLHDQAVHRSTGSDTEPEKRIVRPFNPDTYLLITPGKDGIYGTRDDVNNFEQKQF